MSTTSYTALVIEDEPLLAQSVQHKLEAKGHTVLMAESVERGLGWLADQEKSINFVWLDYYLPEEDGMAFMDKIKKIYGEDHPPVFAITNTAGPDVLAQLMEAGVVQTFIKGDHQLGSIVAYIEEYLAENGESY